MSAAEQNAELVRAYEVCKERGHTPSGFTLACYPPLSVCKFCGTHYRYESLLVESNVPQIDGSGS